MARANYEVEPLQQFIAILGGQPDASGAFPNFPAGLTGQVGVQVIPLTGGLAVIPRTTTPQEQGPNTGVYAVQLEAPEATDSYTLLWDHNNGGGPFITQSLNVGVTIPVTEPGGIPGDGVAGDSPVYITPCVAASPPTNVDLEAFVQGLVVDDATAMNNLIVKCEWEIDAILGARIRNPATGRKIDVSKVVPVAPISPFPGELFAPFQRGINVYQRSALRRAVCAQVEYHLKMGEDFFTRQPYKKVSGPQFSYEREEGEGVKRISPVARQHLDGTGLILMMARLST